jgi:hypothetical protein
MLPAGAADPPAQQILVFEVEMKTPGEMPTISGIGSVVVSAPAGCTR